MILAKQLMKPSQCPNCKHFKIKNHSENRMTWWSRVTVFYNGCILGPVIQQYYSSNVTISNPSQNIIWM